MSERGSISACDYWPACQLGVRLSRFQKLRCCMQLLVILLEVSSGGYFVGQADAFNISCMTSWVHSHSIVRGDGRWAARLSSPAHSTAAQLKFCLSMFGRLGVWAVAAWPWRILMHLTPCLRKLQSRWPKRQIPTAPIAHPPTPHARFSSCNRHD